MKKRFIILSVLIVVFLSFGFTFFLNGKETESGAFDKITEFITFKDGTDSTKWAAIAKNEKGWWVLIESDKVDEPLKYGPYNYEIIKSLKVFNGSSKWGFLAKKGRKWFVVIFVLETPKKFEPNPDLD